MPSVTNASSKKNKGKGRAAPEPVTPAMPLGKQLAHTDKAVRDRAINGLVAFLSRGTYVDEDAGESSTGYVPLSDAEMAKLWKGLFYCFWMSDKPLIQQALASNLAELLLSINPSSSQTEDAREQDQLRAALGFLGGFWMAIVREWTGIDRLRIDKFYMLMRRYINATFRLLARHSWSEDAVQGVNAILTARIGPMTWENPSIPSSISTHLADIYLEELDKVLGLPEVDAEISCPLVHILQPHINLLARTPTPTVHTRIMSSVFRPLLDALSLASPDPEAERPAKRTKSETPVYAHVTMGSCLGREGVEDAASPVELKKGILQAMFMAASDVKAVEVNRRKIYQIWREEGGDDDEE